MKHRNTNWAQIKPLDEDKIFIGSLTCSSACRIAPMDMELAVGFGETIVTKDNELIYSECDQRHSKGPTWTVGDAEKLAAADPDHDWRIQKDGPLHGETFQRHHKGRYKGQWVCIESNRGFA